MATTQVKDIWDADIAASYKTLDALEKLRLQILVC